MKKFFCGVHIIKYQWDCEKRNKYVLCRGWASPYLVYKIGATGNRVLGCLHFHIILLTKLDSCHNRLLPKYKLEIINTLLKFFCSAVWRSQLVWLSPVTCEYLWEVLFFSAEVVAVVVTVSFLSKPSTFLPYSHLYVPSSYW